ncbi:MAG: tryptophan synthase subunit alpha [Prevotellaceae bacterium]|jgi:tryptophan synthase alpha chain|nr:tryptophan synthase subunit alpha [Prevotellaceae bacterium]
MNRINKLFQTKKDHILSVYFTAGFPQLEDTLPIIEELTAQGVDLIEVGMPFSDPMADGVVIQQSSHVALQNGMSIRKLFSQLEKVRETTAVPLVMMGYLNPIMQYGFEAFCRDCARVGIDGLIVPDLPMGDFLTEYKAVTERYGISFIFLITPETSDERIRLIDENTNGFIYMVSSAATTGEQKSFDTKTAYFDRINAMGLRNPRLIGFGISNRETLEAVFRYSSGAIIGSAFIKTLEESKTVKEGVKLLLEKLSK